MDIDQDGCIDSTEDDDDDNDGVEDSLDDCRYTRDGFEVDEKGCSGFQLDDDGDGVHNMDDLCPSTKPGAKISSTGCEVQTVDNAQTTTDSDESSILIWVLFSLAGVIISIALYINFKPEHEGSDNTKTPVSVESTVDNSGSEGHSSTTSSDIGDSSLDSDGTDSQLGTDEA